MGREGVFGVLCIVVFTILSGFIAGSDGQESIRTVQMLWPVSHQGTHGISCFPFQQMQFLNKPFHSLTWLKYERQTSDGPFDWTKIAWMTSQWRTQNKESGFHLDLRGILYMKNVTEADNGTQLRCDVLTWAKGSINVESNHIMLLFEPQEESEYHACPTSSPVVITNSTCSGENNVTHPVNERDNPVTGSDSLGWKISTFLLLATTMVLLVPLGWVVCMYRHHNTSPKEGSDNANHENAAFDGVCSDGEHQRNINNLNDANAMNNRDENGILEEL